MRKSCVRSWKAADIRSRAALSDGEQKDKQVDERDENDPDNEVILGKRRPAAIVIDWANEVILIFGMEFKRGSDQGKGYRKRGEARVSNQHDVLVTGSLEIVANEMYGKAG